MKEKEIRKNVAKLEEIAGILNSVDQNSTEHKKKRIIEATVLVGSVACSLLNDSYVHRKECERYRNEDAENHIRKDISTVQYDGQWIATHHSINQPIMGNTKEDAERKVTDSILVQRFGTAGPIDWKKWWKNQE